LTFPFIIFVENENMSYLFLARDDSMSIYDINTWVVCFFSIGSIAAEV